MTSKTKNALNSSQEEKDHLFTVFIQGKFPCVCQNGNFNITVERNSDKGGGSQKKHTTHFQIFTEGPCSAHLESGHSFRESENSSFLILNVKKSKINALNSNNNHLDGGKVLISEEKNITRPTALRVIKLPPQPSKVAEFL